MSTSDNASQANANSLASMITLQTAANSEFISQAAQAIANAEALGRYSVSLTTFKNCNITALQAYFIELGYMVTYPDNLVLTQNGYPYQDYGAYAIQYPLRNPVVMKLDWNLPLP